MLKKIFFIIIILNLSHCGFTPVLQNNNSLFKITLENFEGNQEINNYLKNNLYRYSNKDSNKNFIIQTNSKYTKIIAAKDSKGSATNFDLIVEVSFNIFFENKNYLYNYRENFRTQKNSNFYQERNYEENIKKNLASLISKKLILQLSSMK